MWSLISNPERLSPLMPIAENPAVALRHFRGPLRINRICKLFSWSFVKEFSNSVVSNRPRGGNGGGSVGVSWFGSVAPRLASGSNEPMDPLLPELRPENARRTPGRAPMKDDIDSGWIRCSPEKLPRN